MYAARVWKTARARSVPRPSDRSRYHPRSFSFAGLKVEKQPYACPVWEHSQVRPTLAVHPPEAISQAKEQLTWLHQQMTGKKLGAEATIFEAHIELLEDPKLLAVAHTDAKQSPAKAWKTAIEERAAAIAAINDPVLFARAADLRDVGQRVLLLMLGLSGKGVSLPTNPVIIVAHELSPSDTASFDPERVLGIGIVEGGLAGGELLAEGTPEQVAQVESSFTGQCLREIV